MALIKYVNNANPFDFVNIQEEDSQMFVVAADVSESDLLKMVDWEDVSGWTLTDI